MGPALTLEAEAILAVDGGIKFTKEAQVWVGDGDSSPSLSLPENCWHLPCDKDFSDFSAALKLMDESRCIHLWGFLGGRKDHELAVWGECHEFLKSHPKCQFKIYQDGILKGLYLPAGSGNIDHQGGFSLLVLEKSLVSLSGDVTYPLFTPTLLRPLSSHGISNYSRGSLSYISDSPILFLFGDF